MSKRSQQDRLFEKYNIRTDLALESHQPLLSRRALLNFPELKCIPRKKRELPSPASLWKVISALSSWAKPRELFYP